MPMLDEQDDERRVFPRITAACPVLYRENSHERWSVGLLTDFSATGLSMNCTKAIPIGTKIMAQLERGRNRVIPALSGTGVITRCSKLDNSKYEIACKMIQFDAPTRDEDA